jgi:NTE family protein
MHRIDGGAALAALPAHSKASPQRATLQQLFELGQASARRWLARHLGAVGHKSSIDLQRDYGDPLRLDFDTAPAQADAVDAPDQPARFLWSPEEQARAAAHADAAARQAVRAAGGELPPF